MQVLNMKCTLKLTEDLAELPSDCRWNRTFIFCRINIRLV